MSAEQVQPVVEPSTDGGGLLTPWRASWWRRHAADLLWGTTAVLMSLLGAYMTLRLWKADLSVPLNLYGDNYLGPMTVKVLQTQGWYGWTPELGAPFGQDLDGWPAMVGDTWNLLAMKLLGFFLSPAATVNVFYILGFALAALTAYVCLRLLRVSGPVSCAMSVAFALLPYHFLRGIAHVMLSSYFALPVACLLAIYLYEDRLRIVRRRRIPPAGWLALAAAVLLAGTGMYYAAFSVALLVGGGALGSIASREWRPLASGAALSAVIFTGLGIAAIPNIVYRFVDRGTTAVEGRGYAASEFFGLKIVNLLLPSGNHRLQALGALRAKTTDSFIPGEGSEALGIVGAIGLVIIVVAALAPWVTTSRFTAARLRSLGSLALVGILCATVAGLNSLFALLVSADLRAWDRISPMIAFLALAGAGTMIDIGLARLQGLVRWPRIVAVTTAGLLTLVVAYDQTSDAYIPDYPTNLRVWQQDGAYFSQLEDAYGVGTAVFQLPIVPFPENPPVVGMFDYDHLRGYLHSDLRWSYGGLKGGEADWQQIAFADGVTPALPKIVATGFEAIYVNRVGYFDHGAGVEAEIQAVTGARTPLVSADGNLATYDIRGYAQRLREQDAVPDRESVLHPVRIDYGEGVYGPETTPDGTSFRWATGDAHASLNSPHHTATKVRISGVIKLTAPSATLRVQIGDETADFTAVDGVVQLDVPIELQPGSTPMLISTDSPRASATDPRDLRQQLVGLRADPLG